MKINEQNNKDIAIEIGNLLTEIYNENSGLDDNEKIFFNLPEDKPAANK